MYMREEDICREYRQAKDKQVQIGILAEQNLCSREEIAAVKLSPKSRTIIGCHYENRDGFAKGSSGADFFKG